MLSNNNLLNDELQVDGSILTLDFTVKTFDMVIGEMEGCTATLIIILISLHGKRMLVPIFFSYSFDKIKLLGSQ